MFKKSIFILFMLFNLNAFAAICPKLNVEAKCENNSWQLDYDYPKIPWSVAGEDVSGKSCDKNNVVQTVKWNYALERSSTMYCSYSVMNQQQTIIGDIQLTSPTYRRDGSNWHSTYPGVWKCDESQESCLISRVISKLI